MTTPTIAATAEVFTTLASIIEDHQAQIERLADTFREQVISPLCKKYRMEFISGMGSYGFSRGNFIANARGSLSITRREDARVRGWDDVVEAFEVLDVNIADGAHPFGFYVADVRFKSNQRKRRR